MKTFNKILLIICVLFLNIDVVHALSVDKNELTLAPGKSKIVGLYANLNEEVTNIRFSLVFSSYDVTASFTPNTAYTYSVPRTTSHLITLPAAQKGNIKLGDVVINVSATPKVLSGNINIHSATATTVSGNTIKLNTQNITVGISDTVVEEQIEQTQVNTSYNLLSKIESDIVKINVVDDVYTYDIEVPNDILQLDLKAVPKKDNYKIDISSQKISELQNNAIKINVISDDNKQQDYVINVKVVERKDNENNNDDLFNIDESKFVSNSSYTFKWIGMIIILALVLVFGVMITKNKKK